MHLYGFTTFYYSLLKYNMTKHFEKHVKSCLVKDVYPKMQSILFLHSIIKFLIIANEGANISIKN